ncbi:mannose-1-phosphate guanylyltransferase [Mangrovibacterium marinum]|uniref:mannose-1-phosphate guanylyltransferase n=1 Tax=Mangrovibacterium marinum TaxID=1639118 RepID=A0A2T5BTU9_9BACT|nr:mannose-1-phosphate guanylyltransferase [Mangrovibacterium marinum]PTN02876.1 mannose-1-phosphate guanylyltransferase [Mangrovibacterium marinum]
MNNNNLVIMAGGVGSRFWPMSTTETPKQFIDILGVGRTLLQLTFDRFKDICPPENIWVVTSESYKNLTLSQLPELTSEQVLLEPCMRNTAPCIAYASWKIKSRNPQANLIVSPADHIVANTEEFKRVIKESLEFTAKHNKIITLGIKPHRPETGYGYIQASEFKDSLTSALSPVQAFREKPNLEKAQKYIEAGNYFWNAGIFVWNISSIENAYRTYLPTMASLFDTGDPHWFTLDEQSFINTNFPNCEKISVDYGIMEQADNIYVYPADFGWSDLGTWGSLYDLLPKNVGSNAVIGNQVKIIDSENCVVNIPSDKKVVIQGLNNFIVAEKDNTLLICNKDDEQNIREYSTLLNK